MTFRSLTFGLILMLGGTFSAGSGFAIGPSIVIVAGTPVQGQPGFAYALPSGAVFSRDGMIVYSAGGTIFEGDASRLTVRHRRGSHLAGIPLDLGVAADSNHIAANDSGDIAFGGWMMGSAGTTGYALFASSASGELSSVFRANDPAPGLPVGTRFGSDVYDLVIDGTGGLVTRAPLLETPSEFLTTVSVWFRRNYGPLQLLVKQGQIPPGAPAPIAELSASYLNRVGEIAVLGTDSTGAKLILVADATGPLRTLIREGDANPAGLTGAKLRAICCGTYSRTISWSASGVAFAARLEVGFGGVDPTNDSVILASNGSGGLRVVAREGDPIPGQPGFVWGQLNSAAVNDPGQIAIFQAYTFYHKELVLFDPVAGPIVVVKTGQPAPGFPPGATMGVDGDDDSNLPFALSNSGALAFQASVSPLVDPFGLNMVARFVRTPSGVLSRVAGPGDVVEIAPGVDRMIYDMSIGSLDESGNMLLDLYRYDPISSFSLGMATAIYSTPEPSATTMVSIGAMLLGLFACRSSPSRRPH